MNTMATNLPNIQISSEKMTSYTSVFVCIFCKTTVFLCVCVCEDRQQRNALPILGPQDRAGVAPRHMLHVCVCFSMCLCVCGSVHGHKS